MSLSRYVQLLAVPAVVAALAGVPACAAAASERTASPVIAGVPRVPVRDLGRIAPSNRIDLTVSLPYRNEAQLDAVISAASDPTSPMSGHFLTPRQFRDSFAPTVAEQQRIIGALQSAGFTVTRTYPNRTIIDVAGRASDVERYFKTEIHRVRQTDVGVRYANARPAYLPPQLRGVFNIGGFDNLRILKPTYVRGQRGVGSNAALGPPLQGPDTGLGPYAFASAYDLPVQHPVAGGKPGQTYDGKGHAAGVAIDADFLDSDLSAYLSYFNVTRTGPATVRVPVDGGAAPGLSFDSVETAIDTETIVGLAPGVGLYVYLMPQLSYVDILDTYNKVVSDDKVDTLNSSFGGCELATSPATFPQDSDHIAKQGAAEGITFNASSGDLGAQTCLFVTPNNLGVSTPASGPHFSAVGGTTLIIRPDATYKIEIAWNGSGGGVSGIFSLPSYQKGVKNVIAPTRNVPDVAFDANPGSGDSLYYNGAFIGPFGGTSLASPIFSALVDEINQVHGKRSGLINSALYARYKKVGYGTQFRDITLGNNSFFGPGYNALPGYDQVTGIGSIVGWPYAKP